MGTQWALEGRQNEGLAPTVRIPLPPPTSLYPLALSAAGYEIRANARYFERNVAAEMAATCDSARFREIYLCREMSRCQDDERRRQRRFPNHPFLRPALRASRLRSFVAPKVSRSLMTPAWGNERFSAAAGSEAIG